MTANNYFAALVRAFRSPTQRQLEAYGRFCHTLSAASLVGAVTLVFTEYDGVSATVFRAPLLALAAMLLFSIGSVFCEGDR